MAIKRLLQEATFDQRDIERMSAAYEGAVSLLRLKGPQDAVAQLVAAKIIQVSRTGETDPAKICARAIKELGVPIPE